MVVPASVALFWIPLGAGGHSVRFNGKVFEAVVAARRHRARRDLYHAALIVSLDGERHSVELAPAGRGSRLDRGVVGTGAVGSRILGRWRLFRYELRCWRGGIIPDLRYAVGGPQILTTQASIARRVLEGVAMVPTPVWGRDELGAGEMWNCNSVIAWLLTNAGISAASLVPPPGGRAPGWGSGVTVAAAPPRQAAGAGTVRGVDDGLTGVDGGLVQRRHRRIRRPRRVSREPAPPRARRQSIGTGSGGGAPSSI